MMRRWVWLAGALVIVAGCKRDEPKAAQTAAPAPPGSASRPPPPGSAAPAMVSDEIPHTTGPIKIDGEWDEPDWPRTAARFPFHGSDMQLARPSSEIRLMHDDDNLYVGLYAADQNIVTATDAFDLGIGTLDLHLDPKGGMAPAHPEVKIGVDADGTVDHPGDDDEEWKLEIAIPLPGTDFAKTRKVPIRASRCDIPNDGIQRCGSWSATLGLGAKAADPGAR